MPVLIKELSINATVTEKSKDKKAKFDVQKFKKDIMAECVETVLQILEDKQKR